MWTSSPVGLGKISFVSLSQYPIRRTRYRNAATRYTMTHEHSSEHSLRMAARTCITVLKYLPWILNWDTARKDSTGIVQNQEKWKKNFWNRTQQAAARQNRPVLTEQTKRLSVFKSKTSVRKTFMGHWDDAVILTHCGSDDAVAIWRIGIKPSLLLIQLSISVKTCPGNTRHRYYVKPM